MLDYWDTVPRFGTPPENETIIIRPSAYGCITDNQGRIAVIRNPKGIYLPGGGIDAGESHEEAVVREVIEECGLVVRIGRWITHAVEFVYSEPERTHFAKRSIFVDCIVEEVGANKIEEDHDLLWVDSETAAGVLSPLSHGWAVGEWMNYRAGQ